MTVHVNLDARKVVPMVDHIRSLAADQWEANLGLPRPERADRSIGIAHK